MESIGDSALVQQVLEGKRDGFRNLVERYFETVRMVALAKTANATDAEDIAQETFLKAYESLGTLRDPGRIAPWLVTIARNQAVSLVRRREREQRLAPTAAPAQPSVQGHERREVLDAVARQVEALPVNLREVVLLHYFEGLKCREIADRLDTSTNAVVKRLARGRDLLGDRLLREWGEDKRHDQAGIERVWGAVAMLPQPDWRTQMAGFSGSAARGSRTPGGHLRLGRVALTPTHAAQGAMILAALCLGMYYLADYFRTAPGPAAGPAATDVNNALATIATDTTSDTETREMVQRLLAADSTSTESAIPPAATIPDRREIGFISGTVYDQDGKPLQDARISVVSLLGSRISGNAASNPNGDFRINVATSSEMAIEALRRERFEVQCTKQEYGPAYATAALDDNHVDIVLSRAAVLEGTVIDAQSRAPITEFAWRVSRPQNGNTWSGAGTRMLSSEWREVRSKEGRFTATDEHGIQAVSILADGYAGVTTPVAVPLGASESGILIALEHGRMVDGVVLDRLTGLPLAGVGVGVRGDKSQSFRRNSTKTDKDGLFSFRDLPTSIPFTLVAGGLQYGQLAQVVEPGNADKFVRLHLGTGALVSGFVRYQEGPPRPIAEGRYGVVYVRGASEGATEFGFSEIGEDGSYSVQGLNDGWYTVDAWIRTDRYATGEKSTAMLFQIANGRDLAVDVNCDEGAGTLEVAVEEVPEETTVRFSLSPVQIPEASLETQDAYGATRSPDGAAVANFQRIAAGRYWLRVLDLDHEETILFEEEVSIQNGQREALTLNWGELVPPSDGGDGATAE